MKSGSEGLLIAAQKSFGIDSMHIHLLSADQDQNLTHLGGLRFNIPYGVLNQATAVNDGAILCGSLFGFLSNPFVSRMNLSGEVVWSKTFNAFSGGQSQFQSVHAMGDDLHLFTRSGYVGSTYYLVSGNMNGDFNAALRVNAPADINHRVVEAISTGEPDEFVVVCEADSTTNSAEFLIVSRVDTAGVIWSKIHDHGVFAPEIEFANGLIKTADDHFIYTANYRDEDTVIRNRLVKMDGNGDIVWARDYFLNEEKLVVANVFETGDAGLITSTYSSSLGAYLMLKLNGDGTVEWSKSHQSTNSIFPLSLYVVDGAEQLWGYNNASISEMDEEGSFCDLILQEGVTSQLVEPVVLSVALTTSAVDPTYGNSIFFYREETFNNVLACVSTSSTTTRDTGPSFNAFPVPFQSELSLDLTAHVGGVAAIISDVQGRVVRNLQFMGGSVVQLALDDLNSGTYVVAVSSIMGRNFRRVVKY